MSHPATTSQVEVTITRGEGTHYTWYWGNDNGVGVPHVAAARAGLGRSACWGLSDKRFS